MSFPPSLPPFGRIINQSIIPGPSFLLSFFPFFSFLPSFLPSSAWTIYIIIYLNVADLRAIEQKYHAIPSFPTSLCSHQSINPGPSSFVCLFLSLFHFFFLSFFLSFFFLFPPSFLPYFLPSSAWTIYIYT